jgi:hypothetical protein
MSERQPPVANEPQEAPPSSDDDPGSIGTEEVTRGLPDDDPGPTERRRVEESPRRDDDK